ncbi:hypothetical protein BP5796_12954 [Coleophoma crateriformis]|uniref:Uncharacterized protein n=1 Tax=Coleophoma crateriformis TaxID=565419 RepID=A0A3D8Q5C5_9HELO|nr:hypothetical protein BP5796_12954 [Coleophoma crateriformis]
MKPQNYSLKFQNSLADNWVTPGSQHGKEPAGKAPKARNGLRAVRKLTKYQQRLAQSKVGKAPRLPKLKSQNLDKDALERELIAGDAVTQPADEKALVAERPIVNDGAVREAMGNDTPLQLRLTAKQHLDLLKKG